MAGVLVPVGDDKMIGWINQQKNIRAQREFEKQQFLQMQYQQYVQEMNGIYIGERTNALSSKTNNEEFDKNGYLVIKNICDPEKLKCEIPENSGIYNYYGKMDKFSYQPHEHQVPGSTSRYYYPPYKEIHSEVRKKIEEAIGKKLFNTYYYDRFYSSGQFLKNHIDRDACEISITVNVSTNLKESWPIWVKTPDTYNDESKTEIIEQGKPASVTLNPGDGMIYKGCERPHWRDPMPSNYKGLIKKWRDYRKIKDDTYYHQVFFHYVLADGIRAHFAGDVK